MIRKTGVRPRFFFAWGLTPVFGIVFAFAVAAAEPSADLRKAIAIGDAYLPALKLKPAEYGLIEAQNVMNGTQYRGPSFWRLTYKSCGGKPATVEPTCKGGEVFIGVDLKTGKAEFLGSGE